VKDIRIKAKYFTSFHTQNFLCFRWLTLAQFALRFHPSPVPFFCIFYCVNYAKTLCCSIARYLHKITIKIFIWLSYRGCLPIGFHLWSNLLQDENSFFKSWWSLSSSQFFSFYAKYGSLLFSQECTSLGQLNPVHNLTFYSSKIRIVFVLPYTPRHPNYSLPFRFFIYSFLHLSFVLPAPPPLNIIYFDLMALKFIGNNMNY
jgi:hypothetical protein